MVDPAVIQQGLLVLVAEVLEVWQRPDQVVLQTLVEVEAVAQATVDLVDQEL